MTMAMVMGSTRGVEVECSPHRSQPNPLLPFHQACPLRHRSVVLLPTLTIPIRGPDLQLDDRSVLRYPSPDHDSSLPNDQPVQERVLRLRSITLPHWVDHRHHPHRPTYHRAFNCRGFSLRVVKRRTIRGGIRQRPKRRKKHGNRIRPSYAKAICACTSSHLRSPRKSGRSFPHQDPVLRFPCHHHPHHQRNRFPSRVRVPFVRLVVPVVLLLREVGKSRCPVRYLRTRQCSEVPLGTNRLLLPQTG